jgi:hypothetical protein
MRFASFRLVLTFSARPPMPTPGRLIRLALVLFPLGLILTSIASFGFWWHKRQQVEERSFAYASALRRELNEAALLRHSQILREVLSSPAPRQLAAVASYIDSSMSPENMGYSPLRDRFYHQGEEVSNVEAELTGRQRPREVHLVLTLYGDPTRQSGEIQALAGMLGLGHSLAGDRRDHTLRLAAVPLGVQDPSGLSALNRLAASSLNRQERLVRIIVLGGISEDNRNQVRRAFRVEQTGAIVDFQSATEDPASTLAQMVRLKGQL